MRTMRVAIWLLATVAGCSSPTRPAVPPTATPSARPCVVTAEPSIAGDSVLAFIERADGDMIFVEGGSICGARRAVQHASLESLEDLGRATDAGAIERAITSFFGSRTYDAIFAFSDRMPWFERYTRGLALRFKADRWRIGSVGQFAGLGYSRFHMKFEGSSEDESVASFVAIVGPHEVSAASMDYSPQLAWTQWTGGRAIDDRHSARDIIVALETSSQRLHTIVGSEKRGPSVVSSCCGASVDRSVTSYAVVPDLVRQGLITQAGILRGTIKDHLLLATTPQAELGFVPAGEHHVGDILPWESPFTTVVLPHTGFPTRKSEQLPRTASVWLAERTVSDIQLLRLVPDVDAVELELDADMKLTVNGLPFEPDQR